MKTRLSEAIFNQNIIQCLDKREAEKLKIILNSNKIRYSNFEPLNKSCIFFYDFHSYSYKIDRMFVKRNRDENSKHLIFSSLNIDMYEIIEIPKAEVKNYIVDMKTIMLLLFRIFIGLGCLLVFSDSPNGDSNPLINFLGLFFVIVNIIHYSRVKAS